jgi:malonyl-CoA O-methyltransferase
MLSERLRQIAQSFGRRADDYDRHAVLQKDIAATLAGFLSEKAAPDVLEIGCGTGFVTEHLFNKYPDGNFLITDLAPEMVSRCTAKFIEPNTKFTVMDGQVPVLNQLFDVIVIGMAAQWFDDPVRRIEELRSFLKPGGVLLFSAPGSGSFMEWKTCLKENGLSDGLLSYPQWPGVVETQMIEVNYGRVEKFLKSLKDIGAHQPREGYATLHPSALRKACRLYNEQHQGVVRWEIVYGALQAAS